MAPWLIKTFWVAAEQKTGMWPGSTMGNIGLPFHSNRFLRILVEQFQIGLTI